MHRGRGQHVHLRQQGGEAVEIGLAGGERAHLPVHQHDHVQQGVQFAAQVAHCVDGALGLGHLRGVSNEVSLWPAAIRSLAGRHPRRLPGHGGRAGGPLLYQTVQASLPLAPLVQHMPDIALQRQGRIPARPGRLHGVAPITHPAPQAQATVFQLQQ